MSWLDDTQGVELESGSWNPRFWGSGPVNGHYSQGYGGVGEGDSIDERNTRISEYDRAWNTKYNGSAGNYTGANGTGLNQQGGGAGGGAGVGKLGLGGTGSLSDRVNAVLAERLNGTSSFFGPKATAQAKGGAFETIQRRLRSNNRQAAEDAIDSGQGEGDAYNQELNSNRRGAAEDYGGASRDIETSQRAGAYQAQSEALQSLLDQTRAEAEQAIAREGNAIQRERIAADQRIAERQLQAHLDEVNRGYQAEQASGRANRDWQDQRDQTQRQWDNEDWLRNHGPTPPMYGG